MSQVNQLRRVRHHGSPVYLGQGAGEEGSREPVWSANAYVVADWMARGFRSRFNQRRSCRHRYLTCEDREGNLVRVETPEGEPVLVPIGHSVTDISDAQARQQFSFLRALPSLVLEATNKTEAQDWFAAVKRRKTNAVKGRPAGAMPRFRSAKQDDSRFVCWFNGGRNAVFRKTGKQSGMVTITGENPRGFEAPGYEGGRRWKLTFHVRLSQPIRPYTSVRVNLTRREIVFVNEPLPVSTRLHTGEAIGLDRGVVHTAAGSNGDFYDAPKTSQISRKIAFHQKRMAKSRVVAGREGRRFYESKRYQAHKREAARLAAHQARIRKDFAQQLSAELVRQFDFVGIEDLRLRSMTRKRKGRGAAAKRGLNRALQNAALAQLPEMLKYKCRLAGVPFVKVPPAYTSLRCHKCGHTSRENRESQAVFRCERCGHADNADTNAARNILELALEIWAAAEQDLTGEDHRPAGSKSKTDPHHMGPGKCQAASAMNREPPMRAA